MALTRAISENSLAPHNAPTLEPAFSGRHAVSGIPAVAIAG
jgi:hypothetical protein